MKLLSRAALAALLITGSIVTVPLETSGAATVAAYPRLLLDPGFETGLASWTVEGAAATAVTAPVRSGAGALRITDTSPTTGVVVRSARLAVVPGEELTASIWVQQATAGAGGSLYLEFWRADGSRTVPVSAVDAPPATGWQSLSTTGIVPDDAVTATVLAYSKQQDAGTTYWDDARLTALPPPLRRVPNAGFEERRRLDEPTQWTSSTPDCKKPSCPVTLLRGSAARSGTGYVQVRDVPEAGAADIALSLLSEAVPAAPGETVTVSAWARRVDGSGASLYLEFRNAAGTRIGVHSTGVGAQSGWQRIRVAGTAPAGTVTTTVRIYHDEAGRGTTDWDDVSLRSSADAAYDPALASGATALFVGDQRVESYAGVSRVVHPGAKGANDGVVLSGLGGGTYDDNPRIAGTVLPGAAGEAPYTMWYSTTRGLGRAISADGLTWDRDGQTAALQPLGTSGVVRNPAWTSGSELPRYFMMASEVTKVPDVKRYVSLQSADGKAWVPVPGARSIPGFDVANVTWDPATRRFVAMIKNQFNSPYGPRTTWVSTSTDFRDWTAPSPAFAADLLDDARIPAGTGKLGTTAWSEIYGMPAIRYGDQYLGIPWIFDIGYSPNRLGNPGTDMGRSHLGVAASRDLVNWSRPNRTDLVTPGPRGSWDFGFNMSGSSFVHVRQSGGAWESRLYYSSFAGEHMCTAEPQRAGQCATGYGNSRIGVATWPMDRFASFRGAGVVTTRPLAAAGDVLTVNYRPGAGGSSLRVEVLDAGGTPVPGYGVADATAISTDARAPGTRVSWGDRTTLPAGPLRLRFHTTGGDLYAFAVL